MAAPPPRKFGEKIALLQAKEAEASAAFESVMADVKNITRQVCKKAAINYNELKLCCPPIVSQFLNISQSNKCQQKNFLD